MKQYLLQSNRILNNDIVHSFCHELFGSGNFDGCLKFDGIYLTINTSKIIPPVFKFVSKNRSFELAKVSELDVYGNSGKVASFSGLFSYSKKDSSSGKNSALIGPNNLSNKTLCEYFCTELIGILPKKDGIKINYIEPIYIKDTQIIHNVFSLQVEGDVVNLDKFEKAIKYGIGQKKSYGFGFINVL